MKKRKQRNKVSEKDQDNSVIHDLEQMDLLPGDALPTFETATHPVPVGLESIIFNLQQGEIKASEAMVYLVCNYLSDWKGCKTFYLSIRKIATSLGMSPSYVSKLLKRLGRFLKKLKANRKGTIYTIKKHDDSPESGKDSRFLAMPHGLGSPIERMFKGHISWKSCLIWIMLKVNSDWSTGTTNPTNMIEIAKLCKMGLQTVCDCIRELQDARLLKRISARNEAAVYQLLPKPKVKKKKKEGWGEDYYGSYTENHLMSRNWQYRICMKTGKFEKRIAYKIWKKVSDYELHNHVPKNVVRDLRSAFEILGKIPTSSNS